MSYCENPCPCGYYGDPVKECSCSAALVSRYQKRISGPLLDRIDIHVEVPRVEYEKLSDERMGEPSAAIRGRVEVARERQRRRFEGTGLLTNGDPSPLSGQAWGRRRYGKPCAGRRGSGCPLGAVAGCDAAAQGVPG